jgi:nitrous oxidase accessory protein
MSTATKSESRGATHRSATTKDAARTRLAVDKLWLGCALAAAALMTIAAFMPLWTMTLLAPQYPDGLQLTAYGSRMAGDLKEINALNHYVGVRALDPGSIVELRLFPYAISLIVLFVAFTGVVRSWHGIPLRWMSAAVAWLVPFGFLADLQFWLYTYGHDLDPHAPFRIPEFTPKVIGKTQVINFHSDNMVAPGFWVFIAAAILLTAGPWLIRFFRDSWQNTGTAKAAVTAAVFIAVVAFQALPAEDAAAQAPAAGGSIQAAIDAAEPGDTVTIPAGVYEENVVIDKRITLQGEGWPVIDGGRRGDVVVIAADGVTLRGFVIRGSARAVSEEPGGIRLTGDNATIEDNRLTDVLYGIILIDSDGHVIRGNTVVSIVENPTERRGHAIYLWYTDHNIIEGNTIHTAKDGIFLGFATFTTVRDNHVSDVRYGIHYMYSDDNAFVDNVFEDNIAGAAIMSSRRIELTGNVFAHNRSSASGYGILMKDVDDVTVRGNFIHHNRVGLTLEGAPQSPQGFVRFEDNLVGYNQTSIEMTTTTNATFVGNSFIGNLQEVVSRGGDIGTHNSWSEGGRGNYWDSYQGYDAGGDGIGDIPFHYEGIYDDLVRENEALNAYKFSLAHAALDLTARWFPVYRPEPGVVDNAPLMSPTVTLPRDESGSRVLAAVAAAAALVAVPLAGFWLARSTFQREWAPC